jgi:multidrug efflux pump
VEASTLRLRPILMTTLATVLGALPLARSAGAGAEARRAIGWVIVGGMTLGTLLTLFVIPAIYTVLVRKVSVPGQAPEGERPAALPLAGEPVVPGSTAARH